MSTYLPGTLLDGLRTPAGPAITARAGGRAWPVARLWDRGFSVDAEADPLPGLVDLYDGERHILHCLVMRADSGGAEARYEFKRATPARAAAPADFAPSAPERPLALA